MAGGLLGSTCGLRKAGNGPLAACERVRFTLTLLRNVWVPLASFLKGLGSGAHYSLVADDLIFRVSVGAVALILRLPPCDSPSRGMSQRRLRVVTFTL
jgi:hypothetical protein